MVLRSLDVGLDPFDLNLQRLDSCVKLLNRHRIEVLFGKFDQWVAGLAREKVVEIHCPNR